MIFESNRDTNSCRINFSTSKSNIPVDATDQTIDQTTLISNEVLKSDY